MVQPKSPGRQAHQRAWRLLAGRGGARGAAVAAAFLAERQRLLDIIEFLPDPTFVIDDRKRVIAWNRAAEKLTGVGKEALLGQGDYAYAEAFFGVRRPILIDLLDTTDEELEQTYKSIHRAGELLYAESFIQRLDGGRGVHLWGVAGPLFDSQGRRIGAIEVVRDVSGRVREEEARAELQSQLLQAQKLDVVGRLAGGVAHDFNNMLGVIIGRAELALGDMEPGDPMSASLVEILKAARYSAELTGQLLTFARKQPISPRILDLDDTVAGLLKMLRRLIGEEIELAWLPGPVPLSVRMDPAQVGQILANLCVNARDAIRGAGKISIETEPVSVDAAYASTHLHAAPGEYALLAVTDSGCGMEPDLLHHIFEPFYTTKDQSRGTGLGLATVYGIVRQNEGFIHVYSEPGRGSCFRIYLPRTLEEADPAAAAPKAQAPRGRGETLLLVEDNEGLRLLSCETLQRLGYRVLAAGSPDEALRLVQDHPGEIQLLLTDLVLPGMNGLELAELLSARIPGLKCLYTSGYTADVIARQGIRLADLAFLQKPYSLLGLASAVRDALGP